MGPSPTPNTNNCYLKFSATAHLLTAPNTTTAYLQTSCLKPFTGRIGCLRIHLLWSMDLDSDKESQLVPSYIMTALTEIQTAAAGNINRAYTVHSDLPKVYMVSFT